MQKKFISIVIMFLVQACAPLNYYKADDVSKIKRIAVLNFRESPDNENKGGGPAISESVVTELSKSRKFVIVEGTQKEEILKQQSFERTGAVDANTVKEIGKILGVDAIIVGHVPEYGKYKTSWGAKNWFWGTFFLGILTGGVGFLTFIEPIFPEVTFSAMVNIRVVSVDTGEILYTKSARASGHDFSKVIQDISKEAVSDLIW